MRIFNQIAQQTIVLMIAGYQVLRHGCQRMRTKFPAFRLRPAAEGNRGDVPGWVLITLMSAVLVAGLLAIAGPALEKLFNEAMEQVKP